MSTIMERLGAYRGLVAVGLALFPMACGSSSNSGPAKTKCTSSAQCLNGQQCTDGACVPITGSGTGGSSGGTGTGGAGAAGSGDASTGCVANNGTCNANGDCCGYPDTAHCVDYGNGGTCAPLCAANADCTTGCCVALMSGAMACAPSNACSTTGTCVGDNQTCNVNGDCCGFPDKNRCVDFGSGTGTCAVVCTTGTDCSTGCCTTLTSGYSVCAPSTNCP
jgi:hypothetical protein